MEANKNTTKEAEAVKSEKPAKQKPPQKKKYRASDVFTNIINRCNQEVLSDTGVHDAYQKYIGYATLEAIFTTDSVRLAAKACASGFWNRRDTQVFFRAATYNSYLLCQKVLEGKFTPQYYKKRVIRERGKEREIVPPKFESKVVQKVLCNYLLRPLLEPRMVSTCYASVKGRGTEKLYQDIQKALQKKVKENPDAYIITTDFKGYFASISIEILRAILEKYIHDPRIVDLICKFSPNDFGLSLGNETSQVPASFFPSMIDHYFKDKIGVRDYFRYMDDTLILADSEEQAHELVRLFCYLAGQLKLTVPEEKIHIYPIKTSFIFCKERFFYSKKTNSYFRLCNPAIAKNEVRKIRRFAVKYKKSEMTKAEILQQVKGVLGVLRHRPGTGHGIQRVIEEYGKIFPGCEHDLDSKEVAEKAKKAPRIKPASVA